MFLLGGGGGWRIGLDGDMLINQSINQSYIEYKNNMNIDSHSGIKSNQSSQSTTLD